MVKNSDYNWDFELSNPKSFDPNWSLRSTGTFLEEYPVVFTLDDKGFVASDSSIEIGVDSTSLICHLMSGKTTIGIVGIFLNGPSLDGNDVVIDKLLESEKNDRLPLGQLVNGKNTKHMKVLGEMNAISGIVFGSPNTEWGVKPTEQETVFKIKGALTIFGYSSHANVAKNPDVIVLLKKELATDAGVDSEANFANQDFEVAETIAMSISGEVAASMLSIVATNTDEEIRASVARNSACSTESLSKLALDSDSWVRVAVAGNSNCSMATLQGLASDSDNSVRRFVAENPATDSNLLLSLSSDFPAEVASNPSAPKSYLNETSNSKSVETLEALATNPKCPIVTLKSLATSKSVAVRSALADNPSTPDETLTLLAKDKNKDVRLVVAARVSTPVSILETLATDKNSEVKWAVAGNPSTPSKTLEKMASKGKKDPYMLGCNPSTPIEVLLSFSGDPMNATNLSQNPATPAEILVQLADDSQNHSFLAFNPSTPEEIRRKVISSELNNSELAVYSLRTLASCKFLTSDDFHALLGSKDASVYVGIVSNPSASLDIVKLATDGLEAMLLGKSLPKNS